MSRLSSFRGPSTPSSSPVQIKQPVSPSVSPSKTSESTYHRKVRALMLEMRACAGTWDDIVLLDGLKAASTLVDTRTELDNSLALLPPGLQPRHHLVRPKIMSMEGCIADLDNTIIKLKKQFQRMNSLVENLESTLYEAHTTKGWSWVKNEPLWTTWSLEKFVSSVPQILIPYGRSLQMHIDIVNTLRDHSTTFEISREALAQWTAQPYLEEGSWDAEWEDLCSVEIGRWDGSK